MSNGAEVLIEASARLGMPILKEGWGWDLMNVADAIADVCPGNAQGACDAFDALHEITGADDLKAWQAGKNYSDIAAVMRDAALCVRR